jgi:hypothetical protein
MAGLALGGLAYVSGGAAARAAGRPTASVTAGERVTAADRFAGSGEVAAWEVVRTATDPPPVVVRERGMPNWPVFAWEQPGGFFEPGEGVMAPPLLAVYGDNTAYADAAVRLVLPQVWVRTLHDQALGVLGAPADLVRDPDLPSPGDRPVDRVRVRTPAGDYLTARLPGWRDGDPEHAYPAQLRELYQQVRAIRRHVREAGRPWRPTGVLLGVVALDYVPQHYREWPSELPVPGTARYQEIRLPDGPCGLPRATGKVWPMYRVGSRFVAATWRRLLPHEIT